MRHYPLHVSPLRDIHLVFNFDPDSASSMSIRGVGIYISEKLYFCKVEFDSNCVEHLWIKIRD